MSYYILTVLVFFATPFDLPVMTAEVTFATHDECEKAREHIPQITTAPDRVIIANCQRYYEP